MGSVDPFWADTAGTPTLAPTPDRSRSTRPSCSASFRQSRNRAQQKRRTMVHRASPARRDGPRAEACAGPPRQSSVNLQKIEADERGLGRAAKSLCPSGRNTTGLAVQQGVGDGQGAHRLDDLRQPVGQVGSMPAAQHNAVGILAGDQSISIVFYFVDPLRPSRRASQRASAGQAG